MIHPPFRPLTTLPSLSRAAGTPHTSLLEMHCPLTNHPTRQTRKLRLPPGFTRARDCVPHVATSWCGCRPHLWRAEWTDIQKAGSLRCSHSLSGCMALFTVRGIMVGSLRRVPSGGPTTDGHPARARVHSQPAGKPELTTDKRSPCEASPGVRRRPNPIAMSSQGGILATSHTSTG
jgi:hypothetical protein